jgi:hypothetical protein
MAHICTPVKKLPREALDAPYGLFISRHRDYIQRVNREVHPHTVSSENSSMSTCVLYAFGFFRERTYRAIALHFMPPAPPVRPVQE